MKESILKTIENNIPKICKERQDKEWMNIE